MQISRNYHKLVQVLGKLDQEKCQFIIKYLGPILTFDENEKTLK